jgi:hypothetical protein
MGNLAASEIVSPFVAGFFVELTPVLFEKASG